MPDGFSQDPPSDTSVDTTFCNYKEPHKAKLTVSRDFTKGAGMSGEVVSTGLRQYGSDADAKESFDALVTTMNTCTSQDFEGETLTYSVIKVPTVGAGSIGIRIESGSSTILQNFALVGPTLVNTGLGGIANADSGTVIGLLTAQVQKYSQAATVPG
jgi:hypothetical protein